MEVTCRAWGDIGVTRQEDHRQSLPMGRAGEKEQSTAVPMVSCPSCPSHAASTSQHPHPPLHPLHSSLSTDVAPSYSATLRIIKHIEPYRSCDWLISKELTN